jgi:trimethylamine--corrinoid protein Co-methyltransferase
MFFENTRQLLTSSGASTYFVLHAAGWLERGLVSNDEKFILDAETCAMLARIVGGIGLSDEDFAWDAFEEVGPGYHFLVPQHTMRYCATAFYQQSVFSMDNYEQWQEKGSPNSYKSANSCWKQMLEEYEPPTLDEAIAELSFGTTKRALRGGIHDTSPGVASLQGTPKRA